MSYDQYCELCSARTSELILSEDAGVPMFVCKECAMALAVTEICLSSSPE